MDTFGLIFQFEICEICKLNLANASFMICFNFGNQTIEENVSDRIYYVVMAFRDIINDNLCLRPCEFPRQL